MERAEKQLLSLIKATRVLTSTLDINEVLDRLIKEVMEVVTGADAGILFLFDSRTKTLQAKNAVGFDMNELKHLALSIDEAEAMTGKTFQQKKGQIFTDSEAVAGGMANMTEANLHYLGQALGGFKFPKSSMCAPLKCKSGYVGVLTIDNFSGEALFSEQDLALLEAFAIQASIAIDNAELFSQNNRTREIHRVLTDVSLSKKGLADLTCALACLIKQRVFVINDFSECICSSGNETNLIDLLLSRHKKWFTDTLSAACAMSQKIQYREKWHYLFLSPIKMDQLTVGVLLVVSGEPLGGLDQFAIEQINHIFAYAMNEQHRHLSEYYQKGGRFLKEIFAGKKVDEKTQAKWFPFMREAADIYCAVLKFSDSQFLLKQDNAKNRQVSRLIYQELRHSRAKVIVLENSDHYCFILFNDSGLDRKHYEEKISSYFNILLSQIRHSSGMKVIAGVGRRIGHLREAAVSYRDALKCTDYLEQYQSGEIFVSYYDLGFYQLFLYQPPEDVKAYASEQLGPLLDYDRTHDTELVKTLKTYIDCRFNMTHAGKKLFVHSNTIKYRMRLIKSLLGVEHIEERGLFEIQLALYLYKYVVHCRKPTNETKNLIDF